MTQGTLVDATIIEAPSSTKNKEQQRDPEMHQTKKGNQWHFGMKAHIGVDAKSGLTHSLVTTAANEHDLNQLGNLLHGRVEHPFRIIKRQFGFVKARYKGLLKNDNQLAMLFTLANLFRADQMIRQWERSH
ncbi:putative transposase [Klebsiella pneumoniae]|nr:putative transposase [Klebsiella pneumoniae]